MGVISFIGEKSINLVASIAILLLGLVFGRVLSKLLQRILCPLELNKHIRKTFNTRFPLEQFATSLVKYIVYITALVLALSQIGLASTIFYILLIGILLILILFILVAIKDFIPNVVAGTTLLKHEIIKVGEIIEVDDIKGRVVEHTLTETQVKTREGDIIWIPNSFLTKYIIKK